MTLAYIASLLSAIGNVLMSLGMVVSAIASTWMVIKQREHGQKLDQLLQERPPDGLDR